MKYIKKYKMLSEEYLFDGRSNKGDKYGIYLNPATTKKFNTHSRGFATIEGDLFVVDSSELLHNTLLYELKNKGFLPKVRMYARPILVNNLDYVISIEKTDNSNTFYLSESFSSNLIKSNYDTIIKIFEKTKEKNPNFKFIVYPVDIDPSEDTEYNKFYKVI